MPASKKQLARYRIIDECLSNRYHMPKIKNPRNNEYYIVSDNPEHQGIWSLIDLIEAINEKLELTDGVSERTVKEDLRRMKEDIDLKYYAPIENKHGIGYYYSDPEYKRTENALTEKEVEALNEIVGFLQQFKGLPYFVGVEGIIHRLEENINRTEFIDFQFDVLDNYTGLDNIAPLKAAIKNKEVVKIDYKAFYEDTPITRHVHPYLLKEYNNRWFLYGYTEEYASEGVYGLERIVFIDESNHKYRKPDKKAITSYFKDIIGVTNMQERKVEKIILKLTRERAHYLQTKPLHRSQQLTGKENEKYVWFSLEVKPNRELIAELLSYGKDLVVEEPESVVREVKELLQQALAAYTK